MVERNCAHCGEKVLKPVGDTQRYNTSYCDNTCYLAAVKVEKVRRVCPVCEKVYYRYPTQKSVACSRECYQSTVKRKPDVEYECMYCGTIFKRPEYVKSPMYCSRKCHGNASRVAVKVKPVHKTFRQIEGYRKWRQDVFKRDNYTCLKCGGKGKICAHHIKAYARYPDLRTEVSNGATLCTKCHEEFHDAYTRRHFTDDNYYEYLEEEVL